MRQVDFDLRPGEILGIAGESGSGKSTLAYAVTRLIRHPGHITGGDVMFRNSDGSLLDVLNATRVQLQRWRWVELAIVFQAAMNAMNPVANVGSQLTDVFEVHRPELNRSQRLERAEELLQLVGIPTDRLRAYPHELSGGMRQRVMIAMALALDPRVVIFDEPTTALDVVVQRDILLRIVELQQRRSLSIIFITHDLGLLLEIADRIAVMYAGRIVELGDAVQVAAEPAHPYTEGLLRSFPSVVGNRQVLTGIPGFPPDLRALPPGCPFHPRCPIADRICCESAPDLMPRGDRLVACLKRTSFDEKVVPQRATEASDE